MISDDKFFGNFFNDKEITTQRLYNFAVDTENKIIAANTQNEYDGILLAMPDPILQLGIELGDVDTSVAVQKGATLTNNQVLEAFRKEMSNQEPFIVRAVGGKGSPGAMEFFPKGLSEYTNVTKTTMPLLVSRINKAATKYATQLGPDLTLLLQAFEKSWTNSRDAQQKQMGSVSVNRTERDDVRTKAELMLLFVVHSVAALNPGDVEACTALVDFSLLFGITKHKHIDFTGEIPAGKMDTLLNRTLKDSNIITAINTDVNAPFCIYLAATENGEVPANAITLQPGEHKKIKPSELGNLKNTFLLLKNLSDVNDGSYDINITGVSKDEKE